MLIKKQSTATASTRQLKNLYIEELGDFLMEKVARDLEEGITTEEIAVHIGGKGDPSGGLIRLLNEYDPESIVDAVAAKREAIRETEQESDAA